MQPAGGISQPAALRTRYVWRSPLPARIYCKRLPISNRLRSFGRPTAKGNHQVPGHFVPRRPDHAYVRLVAYDVLRGVQNFFLDIWNMGFRASQRVNDRGIGTRYFRAKGTPVQG